MLKVTDGATTLLAEARASSGAPENFGVRFFLAPNDETKADGEDTKQIAFKFVPGPEPADNVVTKEKIPVYVAPDASEAMSEATLDAMGEGAEDRRLVLRR